MDNRYSGCPPKMSDGRLFTDYRTATRTNEYIKYINNIQCNNDNYRLFLQNNAVKLMNKEWKHARQTKSCWKNECVHVYPTRVQPQTFHTEMSNYNQLALSKKDRTIFFPCEHMQDYRMTMEYN